MNKFCSFAFLVVCLVLSVNVSFAQKTKAKSKTNSVAQTKVDLGVLRQNTYTNDFFELKVEFPFGWLVGDNTLEAQLLAIKTQSVQTANAKNQKALNTAVNRLVPLLGGYRVLPGMSEENSSLQVMVENLSANPGIKTSRDYLNAVLKSIGIIKTTASFSVSEIKNEMIDGKQIDYIETKYGNNLKRNYVLVKKGFAVLIVINSYKTADFDELHKVLTEADFDYKK